MSARQNLLPTTRQLSLVLDLTKVEAMTLAERNVAVARLASLLMEAAGTGAVESVDDRV